MPVTAVLHLQALHFRRLSVCTTTSATPSNGVSSACNVAGWKTFLWILPFTLGNMHLSQWNPGIFWSFNPHWIFPLTSAFIAPSLVRCSPRYLNSVSCGGGVPCLPALPYGMPWRFTYILYLFKRLKPHYSNAAPYCSSPPCKSIFSRAKHLPSSCFPVLPVFFISLGSAD